MKSTDELRNVIKKFHPYFINEQYKYFMVLTQSCDLVRRNNQNCKTPYITLAAIKNFGQFLEKWMISKKYVETVKDLLLMNSKKYNNVYQFVERLYNNTEPDYFFLYKEDKLHLPESMIVHLKVTFALKSSEHYQTCLDSKIIELSDEFKAKVGWLVGNIYSRVGTTDWDSCLSAQRKKEMFENEISSRCIIGHKDQISQLKKELNSSSCEIDSREKALDYIKEINIESQYDKMIKALDDLIDRSKSSIQQTDKDYLKLAIRSNQSLKSLF